MTKNGTTRRLVIIGGIARGEAMAAPAPIWRRSVEELLAPRLRAA